MGDARRNRRRKSRARRRLERWAMGRRACFIGADFALHRDFESRLWMRRDGQWCEADKVMKVSPAVAGLALAMGYEVPAYMVER